MSWALDMAADWTMPYTHSSLYISQQLYIPATTTNWAAYQMGVVAPFSLRGYPNLKYGQDAYYSISFSYFSADGSITTATGERVTTQLDMGALALSFGSAAIAAVLLAF